MVASPTGQVSSGRIVLENEWRAPTGYSDSEDEEVTTETRLPRSLPRRIRAPSDTDSDEGIAPPTKQARASVVAPLGYDEDAHLIGDPEDVVASAAEAASFSRLARRYQLATSWLPGVHRALFAREDDMSRPPALDTGRVDSTIGSLADQGHLDPHRQKSKQMRKKDPARSLPAEEGWQISHSPTHRVEGNLSLQSNEQVAYGTQEATPIQPQQGPAAVKYSELASAIQSDGMQASPEQLFEPHRRATLLSSPPSEEDALASELFKRLDELVEKERATADVACAFAPMGCVAGPALVWGRSDLDGTAEAALGVLYSTKSQTRMQSPGGELALATFDCADIAAIEVSAHCEAAHQHGSLGKALATAKQRTAFFQSLATQYAARQDEHGEIIVRLMDALYGTSTGSISARHRFSAWLRDCACPRMQPVEEFRTAWHQEHALHPETFHQDGQALDEALFQLSGGCVFDAVRALQHAGNLRLALLISRCVDPQVDVAIDVASQLESWKQDGLSEQSLGSRRLDLLHLLAGQVQRSAGHGLVSRNKSPWFCGPRFSWIRAFALFFWYARPSIIGQTGTLASANSVTRAENQYMQTLNEDDDDEEEDDAAALRALLCDALSTYDAAWQSLSHNQDDTLPNKADAETDSWLLESPPSPPPLPPAQDRAYRYGRLSSDAVFPVSSFDAAYVMLRWYCQAPAFWSPRYQLSPECFGMKCSNALDFGLYGLFGSACAQVLYGGYPRTGSIRYYERNATKVTRASWRWVATPSKRSTFVQL
ncbi:hypothetical protein F1559_002058 [Cyanidiococcus yangmingshanensis]|uniref:Nuclear pore complex protein NUP96 C-terminal domain-containing protein n=1 Tax=Cyanidiococcus yangmingshanensis TaxID=2690220 RepID=A0A7J7ID16_9RHOD|nr:hypothetical protein F1559_002058 [Cyanidiococcus yangmingshanensis]